MSGGFPAGRGSPTSWPLGPSQPSAAVALALMFMVRLTPGRKRANQCGALHDSVTTYGVTFGTTRLVKLGGKPGWALIATGLRPVGRFGPAHRDSATDQ